MLKKFVFFSFIFTKCLFCFSEELSPLDELHAKYQLCCERKSDINEHLPILRSLARDCVSVTEIGIRGMVSTWAILLGLAERDSLDERLYLGIDIAAPPQKSFISAEKLAERCGISYNFWKANDMDIKIPSVDMLFIDSLHTYCHLTYELETFAASVNKYILMHDTSAPWGNRNDHLYKGNYSEYPEHYDRSKKGLWPAVEDFLETHPEWKLLKRYENCHGLTILERVDSL